MDCSRDIQSGAAARAASQYVYTFIMLRTCVTWQLSHRHDNRANSVMWWDEMTAKAWGKPNKWDLGFRFCGYFGFTDLRSVHGNRWRFQSLAGLDGVHMLDTMMNPKVIHREISRLLDYLTLMLMLHLASSIVGMYILICVYSTVCTTIQIISHPFYFHYPVFLIAITTALHVSHLSLPLTQYPIEMIGQSWISAEDLMLVIWVMLEQEKYETCREVMMEEEHWVTLLLCSYLLFWCTY